MAFHFGSTWIPGGFFGVDVFYVLSGFLITSLLLQEWTRSDRIRLARFWARRARRLLPALALVLLAVTFFVYVIAPAGSNPGYRGDALSTLFYFSNWHQIATSTNYFVATGLVSPLTHCWLLAIEEQFYLVWPLVMILVLRLVGDVTRATRVLLAVCAVGAVASAIEMALLFSPGASTTRIYFGADTHAQCILVGGVLSCGLTLAMRGRWGTIRATTVTGPLGTVIDGAALAGLAVMAVAAHFLSGSSTVTYQGGFLLVAVATAAVVLAAVTVPAGIVARMLSVQPLPWLGRISYGMYLWHFPLFIYLSPAWTGLSGVSLAALRVGATVGIAAASFYGIEQPIMQRRFWLTARALLPAGAVVLLVTGAIVAATERPGGAATTTARFQAGTGTKGLHPPPAVIVLGDSTALNLFYALEATAPKGTAVSNGAIFGCGLVIGTGISAYPPRFGFPLPKACNVATPRSERWPVLDARAVEFTRPGDLVLFLAGHDDTQGTLVHGQWTSIMEPAFLQAERTQLNKMISIATSHGAHLDLLTMPCTDINAAEGTPPAPTDSPKRRALFNGLLEQAAAANPNTVSIIDYGSMLCPAGHFTQFLDGVRVRAVDGVHTPAYAPKNVFANSSTATDANRFYAWLAPRLWPKLIASHPS
jgi:peptidoglycan/LPS O-acetylase OafA/YrhL